MQIQESTATPLILTLKLDAESFGFFDALRQTHFPPARNFLKAHVTLFHNLPGDLIDDIRADLRETVAEYQSFDVRFPTVRFLGKGTAIEIESVELHRLRDALKSRWQKHLKPQDLQKFKPHITVQNKVTPEIARELFDELSQSWTGKTGAGIGLQLWHYMNGPWQLSEEFALKSEASASARAEKSS